MNLSPIINLNEFLQIYSDLNVLLFDVRNGKNAKADFEAEHLRNALFVDLNAQLANVPEDFAWGGRHPLPGLIDFATTLSSLGISHEKRIVIYDDKNGANAAARFWWMLRSAGFQQVQILNGGLNFAKQHHFPLSSIAKNPEAAQTSTVIKAWELPTVSMAQVEKAIQHPDWLIIDVREKDRYDGKIEPIDSVAGHIPGAINVPFTENLNEQGLFQSPQVLKAKYEAVFGNHAPENTIVHCGSGVTACHTLLALSYAGFPIPNLYVGSWSEWSRNGRKIERTN